MQAQGRAGDGMVMKRKEEEKEMEYVQGWGGKSPSRLWESLINIILHNVITPPYHCELRNQIKCKCMKYNQIYFFEMYFIQD